ncbi:MAG: HAD-IIB family hydrolase [Clostridia bacterium]|nr:HAD-IIB family hydrolase [Clostridia bacterium]MBR2908673.1 HAD-IIB family hydrolase [Clostridia bacterium]
MGRFDNILIFSDIDGTYLDDARMTVPRNEEAIRRFTAEGGTLAFATGRMERNTQKAIPNITELANFPTILSNGANVYDFRADKSLCELFMEPQTVMPLIDFVMEEYRFAVGIRVTVPGGFLYPYDHPLVERDRALNPQIMYKRDPSEWDLSRIFKIVFRAETDVLVRMQEKMLPLFGDGVDIILSEAKILEAQQKGVSKGSTVDMIRRGLAERGTPKRIVCIGDYENDLEMLRAADLAACPSNALDSVKAVADVIVGSCNDGAVADLIEYIEKHPELV